VIRHDARHHRLHQRLAGGNRLGRIADHHCDRVAAAIGGDQQADIVIAGSASGEILARAGLVAEGPPGWHRAAQAHLALNERATVKLSLKEYERALELQPDNKKLKEEYKDAALTWEADFD